MKRLLLATSALGMLWAMPAAAQQGAAEAGGQGADAGHGVGDIIVTANRRSESVQRSSLALSVIGGETLSQAGVTQASELATRVPGLTISQGGSSVQTYLRGVGSFATDASAESAIAYNINGIYISRPNAIGPIFFDLQRVEVLKGPQGTLYGRNASGGAINLITAQPTQTPTGYLSVDYGNYDLKRVTGALSGGLSDSLSMRAALQWTNRDGYLTDGYNDQNTVAGRLIALWEPSSATRLSLMGEFTTDDSKGMASLKRSTRTAVPSDPWAGPSIGTIQQPPSAAAGGLTIANNGVQRVDTWSVSAQLDQDLGAATLTFIPAYRYMDSRSLGYIPGFLIDSTETSKQQSYELRLGNQSAALKWVAGAYYFEEQQTQFYEMRASPFQNSFVDTPITTRSYAAFGEATFSVSEQFRLIAGLRYSKDKKRQGGSSRAVLPAPGTTNNSGELDGDQVTWKVGAEADVGPQNMLFATASTGYKAGGFFPSVAAPNNSYRPEKLTAFTVGSRNRFLDNALQLNIEGFYWKYDDKQERFLGATPVGTQGLLTTNAGKATLYGFNVDFTAKPSRADTLRFGVEYLHSRYDSFVYNVFNPPVNPVPYPGFVNSTPPEATSCSLGPVVPFTPNDGAPVPALKTDSTQRVDCTGKPLVRAPRWVGSASYEHVFELGGGKTLVFGLDGQFSSGQYLSPDFIASGRDDGFLALDSSLTLNLSRVSISAWGRNLTNQAIYTGGFRYPFSKGVAAGGDPTLFYAIIRPPRTYGVTFKASF
ncbi:MAG: TonB-dependent receptor [Sphingomonadales bacterium]|nr:TonB-dependent receptor [Sphingomonadales bacterium]